jgi:hypothetical protein
LATFLAFATLGDRPEPGQWTGTRAVATAVTDVTDPINIRPNSNAHSPLRDLKLIKGKRASVLAGGRIAARYPEKPGAQTRGGWDPGPRL